MPFNSVRDFLERLEAMGEFKRVRVKVDWDEEITAIATEAVRRNAFALLFENIK